MPSQIFTSLLAERKNLYKNSIKTYAGFYADNWSLRSVTQSPWNSISVNENNGFLVAVANNSVTTNNVMYSIDSGVTWSYYSVSPLTSKWNSIAFGKNIFVAVGAGSSGGTNYNVMYSSNSMPQINSNWTLIPENTNGVINNNWEQVIYGAGIFVAVASSGSSRIMISYNGINWITKQGIIDVEWKSITYGNGVFVAAGTGGSTFKIMYSLDNCETWSYGSELTSVGSYFAVTYSYKLNLFVAIGSLGTLLYSNNGINWTSKSIPDKNWKSITWSQELELFVAVASNDNNCIMTSNDGINWILRSINVSNDWKNIIWNRYHSNFIAVSSSGTNRVLSTKALGVNSFLNKENYLDEYIIKTFYYNNSNNTFVTTIFFYITPILDVINEYITYSISPALPTGIILNEYNGIISGISSVDISKKTYTVTATNKLTNQILSTNVTFEVITRNIPISLFYYNNKKTIYVKVGDNINISPYINGTKPYSFNNGIYGSILPNSGLQIDSKTGVITGKTPSTPFNLSYVITAKNSVNSVNTLLTIDSSNIPVSKFYYKDIYYINVNSTTTIEAPIFINPNNPGSNYSFSLLNNSGGSFILNATVNSNTGTVTLTSFSTASTYYITVRCSNTVSSETFTFYVQIKDLQPLPFNYNNGNTIIASLNTQYIEIQPNPVSNVVNSYYTTTGLPNGLSLSRTSGNISGYIGPTPVNNTYSVFINTTLSSYETKVNFKTILMDTNITNDRVFATSHYDSYYGYRGFMYVGFDYFGGSGRYGFDSFYGQIFGNIGSIYIRNIELKFIKVALAFDSFVPNFSSPYFTVGLYGAFEKKPEVLFNSITYNGVKYELMNCTEFRTSTTSAFPAATTITWSLASGQYQPPFDVYQAIINYRYPSKSRVIIE